MLPALFFVFGNMHGQEKYSVKMLNCGDCNSYAGVGVQFLKLLHLATHSK
jgi:hypothetical protein